MHSLYQLAFKPGVPDIGERIGSVSGAVEPESSGEIVKMN